MNYDNYGISRKIDPNQVGLPKSALRPMNSTLDRNMMEKFGVVAIIQALQEFGGATKSTLVKERAAEYPYYTEEDRQKLSSSGQSVLDFALQWSMSNLKKAGLLTSPKRGYWELTELGAAINIDDFDIWDNVYSISIPKWEAAKEKKTKKVAKQDDITNIDIVNNVEDDEIWKQQLFTKLQHMNPYKFEELIVNLMRKIGIKMETTPKAGDSGIDGIGYLRTPELMTYKIVLQTKRFNKGQVTGPDISNFAGTISGHNADRGIFVTTSTYTNDAIARSRQGSNLITLVDGEELVDLLFEHRMGVSEKTIVVIDDKFFPTD